MALIDLSLAFDTIETESILPAKLKYYGADDKTTSFFKNFFTKRKQYVEWDTLKSKTRDMHNHSCVQGSCLGAPIFNYYTMDLQKISNFSLICFADDTNAILANKDINELARSANTELEKINQYMAANTLLINKQKTAYMIFSPKGAKKQALNEKIYIGDTQILQVKQAKYLGIILDDKLNFKAQFEHLKMKLKGAIRALITVRNDINLRAKKLLYDSLFKSHLEYCSITYMDSLNNNQISFLSRLQKKAVRLIFNARPKSHTSKLFKIAKINPVNMLYQNEATKFIFQNKTEFLRNKQPAAIRELIDDSPVIRETRWSKDPMLIKLKKEYKKGNCIYNIINEWNNGNDKYKMAGNLWILKIWINESTLENIEECKTPNCKTCELSTSTNNNKNNTS